MKRQAGKEMKDKNLPDNMRERPTIGGQDDTSAPSEYPRSATMFGGIFKRTSYLLDLLPVLG